MVSLSQCVLSVFTWSLFFLESRKFVVRAIKTQVFLTLESIIKSSCENKARDLIKNNICKYVWFNVVFVYIKSTEKWRKSNKME